MRPESDESEMDPPPLLGPEASEDRATGGAPGPLLHAPAAMITAMEVVRMRPNLMPRSTLRAAGRFPDAARIRPSQLRVRSSPDGPWDFPASCRPCPAHPGPEAACR